MMTLEDFEIVVIETLRALPGQTLLGVALGLLVGTLVPQFSFHGGLL